MKTDAELQQDVINALRWEPGINVTDIGVVVKDSVITLTGYTDSYIEKLTVERAANRVFGVKAVVDKIEIRLPDPAKHPDEEIAQAAAHALEWNAALASERNRIHERIKVTVQNGWIILGGEVDSIYQKEAAEKAVRNLVGIKGLDNEIVVKSAMIKPQEVIAKIESAFRRNAILDARRITVETQDGKVILKGNVRSWAEREEAEAGACAAPGVSEVINNIVVTP